ncbi:MAG: gamma-glutamylcyclotransferase family protein [Prochlorococcaceae cyanobacterium]
MSQLETEPATIQVFVYGTLKRGLANHHWLAGAVYGGERLLSGALLYDLGPFPMAVASEAGQVHGELYAITGRGLAALDRLEGAPRLFQRLRLPLSGGDLAWVYLGQPHQVRFSALIASGCWSGPRHPRLDRSEPLP